METPKKELTHEIMSSILNDMSNNDIIQNVFTKGEMTNDNILVQIRSKVNEILPLEIVNDFFDAVYLSSLTQTIIKYKDSEDQSDKDHFLELINISIMTYVGIKSLIIYQLYGEEQMKENIIQPASVCDFNDLKNGKL